MCRLVLALAIMVAVCGLSRAEPSVAEASAQGSVVRGLLCRSAVATAERDSGIPAHLLAAISRVESGRREPATGTVQPWPWTVNVEGQGVFYNTKAEAVAAVRAMQASGVRSIDVGCGQINLMHHPDAFPNLEQAFDPSANTAYAARFLKALHARTGDWKKATALYHSATPELGAEYQQRVQMVWPDEQQGAGRVGATPLATAWAATIGTPPPGFSRVPQVQPRGTVRTAGDKAPPGRGFDIYRAAPIGLAYQPPPSRRAGG